VAAGVPVVASTACGLDALPGAREIAPGDVEALRTALRAACRADDLADAFGW